MPDIAVIIPARWGSTRFPGKPLHPIAGKPLLQHVWERARRAKGVGRIVIATDDARIASAARDFGAEAVMTSKRHPSGTDRIAEVARGLENATHVINVQGDEPLIEPRLIARMARTLCEDPEVEMLTVANAFDAEADPGNPNAVKVVRDRAGWALYFSRSAIPFPRKTGFSSVYRHHGIYGYTIPFLFRFVAWKPSPLEKTEQLEQLRALENGARIRVLLTKHASVGVDVPADAALVEAHLAK